MSKEKHPVNDLVRLDDIKDILLELEDTGDFAIKYDHDIDRSNEREVKDIAFCEMVRDKSKLHGEEPFQYYGFKVVERRGTLIKTPACAILTVSDKWIEREKDRIRFENPKFDRDNNVVDPVNMSDRLIGSAHRLMVESEVLKNSINRLQSCLGEDFISHSFHPGGFRPSTTVYLLRFNFYEFDEYKKSDVGYSL